MKNLKLNILLLALSALCVVDDTLKSGGTATSSAKGTAKGDEQPGTLPYGERAKSIFESISDWTPGQFRNAVEVGEAHALRDPEGNTVLHRAINEGNLPIVELLMQDYGFRDMAQSPNTAGITPLKLASEKGEEFAGVFGDSIQS